MIQGAKGYIKTIVPEGSQVGIVEFNSAAYITSYLQEITADQTSRDEVVAGLPSTPYGNTCIGCGIKDGISVSTPLK